MLVGSWHLSACPMLVRFVASEFMPNVSGFVASECMPNVSGVRSI